MPVHTLARKHVIQTSLDEAWRFFADPRNLTKITPEFLGFEVRSALSEHMFAGQMIEYRVRPLLGLPMTWVTEITHIEPMRMFVDEQRIGPYRLWHHEHHFRDLGNGAVEVSDLVTYALPFGWLSEPVHLLVVRPQLERIFKFRESVIGRQFPPKPNS